VALKHCPQRILSMSPFCVENEDQYLRWRDEKLEHAATSLDDLIVEKPPRWLVISAYIFGFTALTIGMGLVFLIMYTIFQRTFG